MGADRGGDWTRRKLLLAGAAALTAPMFNLGRFRVFASSDREYSARTIELLESSLVIDMLNPVGLTGDRHPRWMNDPAAFTDEDWAWIRSSKIRVFHPATGDRGFGSYERTRELFAGWNALIGHNSQRLRRIDRARDFTNLVEDGKIGIVQGRQNSDHFRTVQDVAGFHALGQRVSQLTYNEQNYLGAGSLERRDGGLSVYGVSIVEEMNRVGMTVDVSHCGDVTTLDAFEASSRPVAITHSNCRALNPDYRRCKTDEAIRKMAAKGGVMGLTTLRAFVRKEDPVTVEHLIDHVDHVVKLVGIEHVGIGSDADLDAYGEQGMRFYETLPPHVKDLYRFRETIDIVGLDHPQRLFDITEALIRRGYTPDHIRGILGANFARMLEESWSVTTPSTGPAAPAAASGQAFRRGSPPGSDTRPRDGFRA